MRIILGACLVVCLGVPLGADVDPDLLAGLGARSIGPAAMSGRVAAVEAVAADPKIVYVGAATGGVWKSSDGGVSWKPIFDDQPVAAIGAIAVFQASPDVVWVGTGEGNPRNSASVGNGVYRSLDGGVTWSHLGLADSERIHRIVLHPSDPDVAWVAALGKTWGEHTERGVFKTIDGGKTWRKVLFVDERTGAADLVADPRNPQKLFAAMWQHRRWPWFFQSGGPGSGVHVSHDGGETWKRLTPEDGLPEGELGRVGLAIAPSDPQIVYALVEVEGEENVFLRSQDGGRTFKQQATTKRQEIGNRPFYYADLRVDPVDPQRVYSLWSIVTVSDDGGKTWQTLVPFGEVHPDHHALWINPRDPHHLINGNDGGVYVSRDRGHTWTFVRNLPFAQFYHVRVDDEHPYNVYGGLQDNGSWKGPSAVWENGGIRDHHWSEVLFGDGFDTVPDPRDSTWGYAMSQEGYLARWSLRTGEQKLIRPAPRREGASGSWDDLRFNWNAAIAIDPFDPDTIYYGSQYVHRSRDRGETWEIVSPDLTTDRPEWQRQAQSGGLTLDVSGAENFTTVIALAPSPLAKGVLWAGTDDGRLHLTRDGGAKWASVEANFRGVPANTWIPHVEPSRFDPAEAFVVLDDHRRANWTPYVLRTRDYGKTWESLATKDLRGYCLTIVQDPVDRDLLFLGTEFGLWFSIDGGKRWLPFRHGVPTVSVMDLAIQAREKALVVATHGRGLYVIDDLQPLRDLTASTLDAPLHLFQISTAQQYRVRQSGASRFPGDGEFRGANLPYGARIFFSLDREGLPHPDDKKERLRKEAERRRKKPADADKADDEVPKVEIRVADAAGKTIRTLRQAGKLGVNRVIWDLAADAFKQPPEDETDESDDEGDDEPTGPEVPPGTYTVTVSLGELSQSGTIEVKADPRFEIAPEARQARWAVEQRLGAVQNVAVTAIERLRDLAGDLARVRAKRSLGKQKHEIEADALIDAAEELETAAKKVERRFQVPPDAKGIEPDDAVLSHVGRASYFLSSSWEAPSPTELGYLERAEAELAAALPELEGFFRAEVTAFRLELDKAEIRLLPAPAPLEVPASP